MHVTQLSGLHKMRGASKSRESTSESVQLSQMLQPVKPGVVCVAGVRRGGKGERRAREAREDRTREDRGRGRLQGRLSFSSFRPLI